MSRIFQSGGLSPLAAAQPQSRFSQTRVRAGSAALPSLLCLFACAALPIRSQTTDTGTVLGAVADPSGAAVPAGAVDLRDLATGAIRSTVTNASGRYTFVGVKPGTYALTAAAAGFEQSVANSVAVEVGRSSPSTLP